MVSSLRCIVSADPDIQLPLADRQHRWPTIDSNVGEPLSLPGLPFQQQRRPEIGLSRICMKLAQPLGNRLQTDLIGPVHQTAPIGGKAVTTDPDGIDIQGARRYPLSEISAPSLTITYMLTITYRQRSRISSS